jgi:hypothetical protein
MQLQQQLAQQNQPRANTPQDPLEAAMQAAQTAEERDGINLVRSGITHYVGGLLGQLQQQQQAIQALQQGQQQTQQRLTQQGQQKVLEELQSIRNNPEYADFDRYAAGVKQLYATVNPATNQYYTMEEAYKVLSGRAAAESQQAQQQAAQTTRQAKQQVAPQGGLQNVDVNGATPLSDDEVLAMWDQV